MSPGTALCQTGFETAENKRLTTRFQDRNAARALSAAQNNKKQVNNAKVQTNTRETLAPFVLVKYHRKIICAQAPVLESRPVPCAHVCLSSVLSTLSRTRLCWRKGLGWFSV